MDPIVEGNQGLFNAIEVASTDFIAANEDIYAEGASMNELIIVRGEVTLEAVLAQLGDLASTLPDDEIEELRKPVSDINATRKSKAISSIIGLSAFGCLMSIDELDINDGPDSPDIPNYPIYPTVYRRGEIDLRADGELLSAATTLITPREGLNPIGSIEIIETDRDADQRLYITKNDGRTIHTSTNVRMREMSPAHVTAFNMGLSREYMAVIVSEKERSVAAQDELSLMSSLMLDHEEQEVFLRQLQEDSGNRDYAMYMNSEFGTNIPTVDYLERLLEKIRANT